jgi:hypothetical protein
VHFAGFFEDGFFRDVGVGFGFCPAGLEVLCSEGRGVSWWERMTFNLSES